jgi:hypothetical protein
VGGRLAFAPLALLASCAAGKFHDEVDIDGARLREGMPSDEITKVMGSPDFVSKAEHRFAWEFRKTGRPIEPQWEEWVWFDEDEIHTYVAYVSGATVRRVGVITSSPPPPRSDGFGTFISGCD